MKSKGGNDVGRQFVDELDKGIIQSLARDGRMPFSEIADRLQVTEKTVRTRYKSLIDRGILKVTGVVNPVSIGIKVVAIIQIAVKSGFLTDVKERLMDCKNVRFITYTSGEYQYLIQVYFKTYEELTEFTKRLNDDSAIQNTNVIVQFEVYKNTFDYL